MEEDCIFCKIAKGEIKSEKIYDSDNFFAIFDIKPKAEGHCLVISKNHFENVLEMPCSLGLEFLDAVKDVSLLVMKKVNAEGFNLILNNGSAAGQVVGHFHCHIIPRKSGDGLKGIA